MYKENTYQRKVQSISDNHNVCKWSSYLQWFIEGKHAQHALVTMQGPKVRAQSTKIRVEGPKVRTSISATLYRIKCSNNIYIYIIYIYNIPLPHI